MLPLFYDPIYTEGIDPIARFPRDRYRLLVDRLIGRSDIEIRRPRLATREELILAHAPTYINQFIEGRLPDEVIRRIGKGRIALCAPTLERIYLRQLLKKTAAEEQTIHRNTTR